MREIDLKKLDAAFKQIDKEVGKGFEKKKEESNSLARVKLESPLLNYITNGGLPYGQIVEIYGPESSGKSLIAQQIAVDYQREGNFVCYIDVEFSFDFDFAESLGLDTSPERFRLYQPDCGEQAYEIAEMLSNAGVGIIIFDSIAGMTPSAEFQAGYGDQQMGIAARLHSKGMRKLAPVLNKNKTTAILINQIREKIGVLYGNPETTPGGRAIKFYASLRLNVRKKEFLTKGGNPEPYGIVSSVEGFKSKIGPPKRKGLLTILFDSGIDTTGEYIDFAIKYDLIKKGGSWFTLPDGETRLQGKDNVRLHYLKNLEELEVLKQQVSKFFDATNNVENHEEETISEKEEEVEDEA